MRVINLDDDDVSGSGAEAIARVKQWLAASLTLPPDAIILVTELRCREEGCPPLETVLAVLAEGQRWHTTVHKAAAALTEADVRAVVGAEPPAFSPTTPRP